MKLALIGNKSDCENRVIKVEDREKFAGSKGILSHDVSAKTGDEVDRLFVELSKQLMQIHPKADQVLQGNSVVKNTREKIERWKIEGGAQSVQKEKKCC